MSTSHTLETQLERLLRIGTIVFSVIIGAGVLIDAVEAVSAPVNLVTTGIVGFIALPVIRLIAMLTHYISIKDLPMMRVVGTVITLVIVGVILGIL